MGDAFVDRFGVSAKSQGEMDAIANAFSSPRFQRISIKTANEIDKMRAAGHICAEVLEDLSPHIVPGVTLKALN
jgi:Xaa-Pro aminopeptidase